jgi:hypothetical protein
VLCGLEQIANCLDHEVWAEEMDFVIAVLCPDVRALPGKPGKTILPLLAPVISIQGSR